MEDVNSILYALDVSLIATIILVLVIEIERYK